MTPHILSLSLPSTRIDLGMSFNTFVRFFFVWRVWRGGTTHLPRGTHSNNKEKLKGREVKMRETQQFAAGERVWLPVCNTPTHTRGGKEGVTQRAASSAAARTRCPTTKMPETKKKSKRQKTNSRKKKDTLPIVCFISDATRKRARRRREASRGAHGLTLRRALREES